VETILEQGYVFEKLNFQKLKHSETQSIYQRHQGIQRRAMPHAGCPKLSANSLPVLTHKCSFNSGRWKEPYFTSAYLSTTSFVALMS